MRYGIANPRLVLRTNHGVTLIELMVAVALGTIVMLPIGIFMVQMTKASTAAVSKTLLASRVLAGSLTVRTAIFKASAAEVRNNGATVVVGAAGNELHFGVGTGGAINHYLKVLGGNLVLFDGVAESILVYDVTGFSVTETATGGYSIVLTIQSNDGQLSCALRSELLLFNADTQG